MAQEEKYGNRDLTYSAWHRTHSTGRFVGADDARLLAQIDMDHVLWIEYDDATKMPLALIEEARDTNSFKPATVTTNLAKLADLPALCVLWTPSDELNPADSKWPDIERFRVKRLYPNGENGWREFDPKSYAELLLDMRRWKLSKLRRLARIFEVLHG